MKAVDVPTFSSGTAVSSEPAASAFSRSTQNLPGKFAQLMERAIGMTSPQDPSAGQTSHGQAVPNPPDEDIPFNPEIVESSQCAAATVPLVLPAAIQSTGAADVPAAKNETSPGANTALPFSQMTPSNGNLRNSATTVLADNQEPTVATTDGTAPATTMASAIPNTPSVAVISSTSATFPTGGHLASATAAANSFATTSAASTAEAPALDPAGASNETSETISLNQDLPLNHKPAPNESLHRSPAQNSLEPRSPAQIIQSPPASLVNQMAQGAIQAPPVSAPVITTDTHAPNPPVSPGKLADQKLPGAASPQIEGPAEEFDQENIETIPIKGKSVSLPLADSSGTSGAKYPLPMEKAEKTKEFTGSSEQNLPGTATSALDQAALSRTLRLPGPTASSDKPDVQSTGSSPSVNNTTETFSSTAPLATAISPRSLERTQDLIALHSMRLRDSGHDSMQMVIKPDPNLHLALNLRMRDGAIEVSAELQRGDYQLLNRHWGELQQQMESRGIRLAPLSQSESSASHGSGNFSRHSGDQHSEDKAAKNGAFAEFALSSVLVPKRNNKTTSPRGWESWA
jgi:hypothetical protein